MKIELSFEHGRVLFDSLCSSLDFGSGFLDNEDVDALRALAREIGVAESVATPENFMVNYYPELEALPKYSSERYTQMGRIRDREEAALREDRC